MSNLFSDLQKVKEEQEQTLHQSPAPAVKEPQTLLGRDAQKDAQKNEQMSKPVSKGMSRSLSQVLSKGLSADAIEELGFRLRKTPQAKINATIPLDWKDKFDDLAYRLKVGKYDLLTYVVGVLLGEVDQPET